MKAKTFVACVLTASALPFAPALAQQGPQPSGPQGTGAYGAANAAVPVPQIVSPADTYVAPLREDSANRGATVDQRAYERRLYDGPSWATNPPVPAP